MMNPKLFVDLYNDRLQAEEIESKKNKNSRTIGIGNYIIGGT